MCSPHHDTYSARLKETLTCLIPFRTLLASAINRRRISSSEINAWWEVNFPRSFLQEHGTWKLRKSVLVAAFRFFFFAWWNVTAKEGFSSAIFYRFFFVPRMWMEGVGKIGGSGQCCFCYLLQSEDSIVGCWHSRFLLRILFLRLSAPKNRTKLMGTKNKLTIRKYRFHVLGKPKELK